MPRTGTGRGRGMAQLILDLDTRRTRMINFVPLVLYPKDRTPVTTELQAVSWTSKPGRFAADINILPLPTITTLAQLSQQLMLK
jgi:hypothetical protein